MKFKEDFERRHAWDFEKYMFFCTAYVSAPLKREFALYCLETLQAELVTQDIEALRCYLDGPLTAIREHYLGITNPKDEEYKALLIQMNNESRARLLLYDAHKTYGNAPLEAEPLIRKAVKLWPAARQEEYRQLGISMAKKVIEQFARLDRPGPGALNGTAILWNKYSREELGQLTRGAIDYLEETVWDVSAPDLEGLADLACMYAYQRQFSRMLEAIDRALECGEDATELFREPLRLVALLAACERDQARGRQLAKKIGLSDVTEASFCQAIRDHEHIKHPDYITWLAMKNGDLGPEGNAITVIYISPPYEQYNGLVSAFSRSVGGGNVEEIASVNGLVTVEKLYDVFVQSFWLITPLPREESYL